jgi:hypothetical protein
MNTQNRVNRESLPTDRQALRSAMNSIFMAPFFQDSPRSVRKQNVPNDGGLSV